MGIMRPEIPENTLNGQVQMGFGPWLPLQAFKLHPLCNTLYVAMTRLMLKRLAA
jgi:hypothetical protein